MIKTHLKGVKLLITLYKENSYNNSINVGGKIMNIIVNYPTTKEGMDKLDESLANAVLKILEEQLTSRQLDKLMSIIGEKSIIKN